MLSKVENFLSYWVPPVLWMVLIFYFSSFERHLVSQQKILNFLFFKLLHVLEYAFLFFLNFRAINRLKTFDKKKTFIAAFIVSVVYAVSDEVHQTFVPTREGRPRDVFIDFAGMSIMYIYMKKNFEFLKKQIL